MPSEASLGTVFSHIFNALMHLATTSPSGTPAAQAAVQAAHNEVQSWFPPPPPAEAPPPDPAHPETEADGDGPPADPTQQPAG